MLPKIEVIDANSNLYFVLENPDIITRELKSKGDFAREEKNCCAKFIKGKENITVLDIGANIGTFAVGIAKILDQVNSDVVCFEPQRVVYHQLCGNIFLNRLDNVQTFNCAVGDINRKIKIPVLDYSLSTNPGGFTISDSIRENLNKEMSAGRTASNSYKKSIEHTVDMIRIDDLNFEKEVAFIKIDVEGFELECLTGSIETIKKNNFPPIVFEDWGEKFSWYQNKSRETFQFLTNLGYKISQLENRNYLAQFI